MALLTSSSLSHLDASRSCLGHHCYHQISLPSFHLALNLQKLLLLGMGIDNKVHYHRGGETVNSNNFEVGVMEAERGNGGR